MNCNPEPGYKKPGEEITAMNSCVIRNHYGKDLFEVTTKQSSVYGSFENVRKGVNILVYGKDKL